MYGAGGDGQFSPIDTADIAEIAGKILLDPKPHIGQAYVLTGPELLTYGDEAAILSKLRGSEVKFVNMPVDKYAAMLEQYGQKKWNAKAVSQLEEIILKGYAAVVDPTAEKLLGRKPAEVEEWLTANIAMFK